MNRKVMFVLFVLMIFPLLACQVTNINPQSRAKLILKQQKRSLFLFRLSSQSPELTIQFGAGKLTIILVHRQSGGRYAVYNVSEYKPVVTTNGNQVTLSVGDKNLHFHLPQKSRIFGSQAFFSSNGPRDISWWLSRRV